MAALLRCVYVVIYIISNILVSAYGNDKYTGFSLISDPQVTIHRLPDDSSDNNDIHNTIYHVFKRAAESTGPIKKATQMSEKKPLSKSAPIFPKMTMEVHGTDINVTSIPEMNTTLNQSKLVKNEYNTEIASTPATTTAALMSSTTELPDVFPTRPSNITNTTVDYHVYYNSTLYLESEKAMSFWVDFETLPQNRIVTHHMLSASHRRAATVLLSFDFPFYGHLLRNITIATGGFLYMGGYMHSWLAATQYVAPLMANFDTSLSNDSTVRYYDNGTAFVIEWNEVALQDEKQGGNYTFQATLLNNGNIIFVYQTIPASVTQIKDESHPVKVGLSDAYVIDRIVYFIRRKTIYEYHRVDMKRDEIGNHTAIYFTALATCLKFTDCNSCMGEEIGLDCVWCESAKRCSDGLDRLRQDWLQQQCDVERQQVDCNALPPAKSRPVVQPFTDSPHKTYTIHTPPEAHGRSAHHPVPIHPNYEGDEEVISQKVKGDEPIGVGGVVGILLILSIVLGIGTWIGYAYRNPHSSSGQLLIRYRPTQWRFRSGEARYTAASVHM